MDRCELKTDMGTVTGNEKDGVREFLGVRFAKAGRFRYSTLEDTFEGGKFDASAPGPACPQLRMYHPHPENPHRLFYYKEFREGIDFTYDEDCLRLNIYTPAGADKCPVIIFFHGGGFDSGANSESAFDGTAFAKLGVITVFAQYRVGVLGYLTHEDVFEEYGRDGNFGLDDQLQAIRWVKKHIADFGGDPDNITLAGQSAGAISIQYFSLNHGLEGLFQRVIMMSGAGLFPKFALPRKPEDTRAYWLEFAKEAGLSSLEELRNAPVKLLIDTADRMKSMRKDTVYNTMPVVDGCLIPDAVDRLIKYPLKIGYMIGFTNTDMYAPVMAYIGMKFAKDNNAYVYFFDIDAPGDANGAFHSCDLRYMFGTLDKSHRPYGRRDREVARQLAAYAAGFAKTGDPNSDQEGSPVKWMPAAGGGRHRVLRFAQDATGMDKVPYIRLLKNMLSKGDPKAAPESPE